MDYLFTGTLTDRDIKQHLPHPFEVPEGATELDLRFDYTPGKVPHGFNAIHLSLFDPQGSRGAGHRSGDVRPDGVTHTIRLDEISATPGYVAGPLVPGTWSIVIDTHMILPDAPVNYTIAINVSTDPVTRAAAIATPAPTPPQRGAGWYRGDLHAHTLHSDGAWEIPDLLAHARAYKLDFITLSDHNTISGLAEFDRMARPDLLTMGGIELTTYSGHALALGVRRWVDWRVRPGERTMPQIAAEVGAAGGTFVIAHPMSIGDPHCTGCDWRYKDMMPGNAKFVEIWNGGIWENNESNNENALMLWYTWLNQGHRLVATSGTDIHGPAQPGAHLGFDVVYAEELDEAAILRGVSQGHLYLSDGPRLDLSGHTTTGTQAMMGDTLVAERATITAHWDGCDPDDCVRLIVDGHPMSETAANARTEQEWQLSAEQAHWCVLEVRAATGHLRAVTNPIFLDSTP
jgi:hypothetical protein